MVLTWVDWGIIAIIATSGLLSIKRGFVKEALSLVTWIVAGVVAWLFGGALSHYFEGLIATPSLQVIAACALLFVVTLLVGALVNFLLGQLVRVTGLTDTDRFLGMAFGAARGGLLVIVLVGLLSLLPVQQDVWWRESLLLPHFLLLADWSKDFILRLGSHWAAGSLGSTG